MTFSTQPTPAAVSGPACIVLFRFTSFYGERLARVQFLGGWLATVYADSLVEYAESPTLASMPVLSTEVERE